MRAYADYGILDGVRIGATWRIRLNRPCALAMQPYYSRSHWPCIALAIAEDCWAYILLVLFYLFSVHRFFDVPRRIFAKLCYTMRHVLKLLIISYVGIHTCPLKIEGRKTPISHIAAKTIDATCRALPRGTG